MALNEKCFFLIDDFWFQQQNVSADILIPSNP